MILKRILSRHLERGMEEEVLMTDANLRDSETEKGTGNAAQHLVEIDDDVGSTLLNILSYQMDTGKIAGSKKRVVSQGAQEIELAIVLRRQEIRTVKTSIGLPILSWKNSGITLFLLLPTKTFTTSWPSCRSICLSANAWVR